jgi:SprT protein
MNNRFELVAQHTQEVLEKARQTFGVHLRGVQVRFDLRGKSAGIAGWTRRGGEKQLYLRFNVDLIRGEGFEHVFKNTVPHEVAHLVCYENPALGRNHDRGWARVCRALGGNAERCHTEEITYAKGRTYYYTSTNGKVVTLSQVRHKKIQMGAVYRFKHGWGQVDRTCKWSLTNSQSVT